MQYEITMLTKSMSLYSELKTKVKDLLVGQKRLLSLAIALIGDSKVIILGKIYFNK
jgi:ABC-type multidrug transport system ATPase subunit